MKWIELFTENSTDRSAHSEGQGQYLATPALDEWNNPITNYFWAIWHWLENLVTYYRDVPYNYVHETNNIIQPIIRTFKLDNLPHGSYDIRVSKLSADNTNYRVMDDLYLSSVREVRYDDFIYPRVALAGVKALATNQLSGSLNFSCLLKGLLIRVYRADEVIGTDGKNYRCILNHVSSDDTKPITGGSWSTYWSQTGHSAVVNNSAWVTSTSYTSTASWRVEYSNNPAWVCVDIMTQPLFLDDLSVSRYEALNPSRLVIPSFQTWADFCDALVDDGKDGLERRIEFNGAFDSETSLWEAVLLLCKVSRAILVRSGYDYSIVVDKAGSAEYLFSSGNIIADSFEETFLSLEERAGEIEVSFLNKENDYKKEPVSYFNTSLDKPLNKVTLQGFGITSSSQAWRYANFSLACNQYQTRFIKFDVPSEAMRCTVGNIIKFQHDVPRWGLYGGLVGGDLPLGSASATANSITLDQQVTLEGGKNYSIIVKLNDDTLVTKAITNSAGTYKTLSISGVFTSIPNQYDRYALGETDIEAKLFRVTGVSRTQDTIYTISCVEYSDSMYALDSGASVAPALEYSSFEPISVVTGLTLFEHAFINEVGVLERNIEGNFTLPANVLFAKAEIWYRVSGQNSWSKAGETPYNTFTIPNVLSLTTYQVLIVSVSWTGIKTRLSDFAPVYITTTGSSYHEISAILTSPTGLQIFNEGSSLVFYGKDCKFVWDNIMAVNISGAGAGEEEGPLQSLRSSPYFRDYEVEIYTPAGVRLRTDYVRYNEFMYTFEHNIYDNGGIPNASFEIRVRSRDVFGNMSEQPAKLLVTNGTPVDVQNIFSYQTVGGVSFGWDKNTTDVDLLCYRYRTKVETSDWSDWADTEDNNVVRRLTSSEITLYTNKAYIHIEVKCKDVYGNLSSGTAYLSAKSGQIADNIFQMYVSQSGVSGSLSDLYDGDYDSGGVTIA